MDNKIGEDLTGKLEEALKEARRKEELARHEVEILERLLGVNVKSKSKQRIPLNPQSEDKPSDQQSLMASPKSIDEGTPGNVIKKTMINANGHFNVPGIVNAVSPQFPDLDYKYLSRTGSQVASRLAKTKKIKLVDKGIGREPNTYVSTKLTSGK